MADTTVGKDLLDLRRELAWASVVLPSFHAASDKQRVRDRVFDLIARAKLRVDATILDKMKTQITYAQIPFVSTSRPLPTFQVRGSTDCGGPRRDVHRDLVAADQQEEEGRAPRGA
jgi:hypothetical protein